MINYWAVLAAAIVSMVVGGLWYSPAVLGRSWMRELGKDPENMKGMSFPAKLMALQFVASLVTAYVLAFFCYALQALTVGDAVEVALWVWLGFFATTMVGPVLWEGRSWKLYLIHAAQTLVMLVLMGAVIGLWL